ncbi:MAG: SAM-dependent methyltransferase [Clostridia bacterium]|nr:SAM-dependent methyltransferase [Clostridia bacterium]
MLDTRLKMIYELLQGNIICDVGTDHCKLAAFAIKSGSAAHAFATDINEGPLSAAKRLIEKEGLSDKIETFLSDGFLDIPKDAFDKTDCFVIAGMGGELIRHILQGRKTDAYLVLQPMTAINELVTFLCENGYRIEKRTLCKDGDKIYHAMLARFDGVKREPRVYGGYSKTPLYFEYLEREKKRIATAIRGIESSEKSDKSRLAPLFELEKEIENESK